jgi:hypothetical protein
MPKTLKSIAMNQTNNLKMKQVPFESHELASQKMLTNSSGKSSKKQKNRSTLSIGRHVPNERQRNKKIDHKQCANRVIVVFVIPAAVNGPHN